MVNSNIPLWPLQAALLTLSPATASDSGVPCGAASVRAKRLVRVMRVSFIVGVGGGVDTDKCFLERYLVG